MSLAYSVIIPAYNEADSIGRALRETAAVFASLGKPFEIIAVDDGSADGTAAAIETAARELSCVNLIRHGENRGKGEAVRTGVVNTSGDIVLFLDADLATHPSEAPKFIAALDDAEIAIGSRRAEGAVIVQSQPWHRIAYGRAINFLIRHFLKLPHNDTQCGFKMFKGGIAREIFSQIGSTRWTFDVEILVRARAKGYRIAEVPVRWTDGRSSRVKMREVLSDLRYLLELKKSLD